MGELICQGRRRIALQVLPLRTPLVAATIHRCDMTHLSRAVFAVLIGAVLAGPCWGQRLIPPPRFIPPPRIPVTPFRPPTYVPKIPATPPPHIPSSPIGPPASEPARQPASEPARQPANESEAPAHSAAVANNDQG